YHLASTLLGRRGIGIKELGRRLVPAGARCYLIPVFPVFGLAGTNGFDFATFSKSQKSKNPRFSCLGHCKYQKGGKTCACGPTRSFASKGWLLWIAHGGVIRWHGP